MSLKDLIARDIDNIFLNTNDFCDNLVIQIGRNKYEVVGSLQSNLVQNNSGNGQPLQEDAWTLYIKYPIQMFDTDILSAGTRITINNDNYTIVSVSNEMGLATIALTTKVGR